jgi:hypothetical protein
MRSRNHGQVKMREQDRQAIGHHDRASQTALASDACVANTALVGVVIKLEHLPAMNLL